MNATRAATIRLRSSFDGAVSLGRVQTPTLAILGAREVEIREFVRSPTGWSMRASRRCLRSLAVLTTVASTRGPTRASRPVRRRLGSSAACEGQTARSTKLDKSERRDRPPLLYDLTSLQSEAL